MLENHRQKAQRKNEMPAGAKEQDLEILDLEEEDLEGWDEEEGEQEWDGQEPEEQLPSSPEDRQRKKKRGNGRRIAFAVLMVLLFLILAAAAAFCIMSSRGREELLERKADPEIEITVPSIEEKEIVMEDEGETVIYEGRKYHLNEAVTSILFMGIDREELNDGESQIGNSGQADCIFLGVLDTESGKISILAISRDSMVDVNNYDTEGNLYSVEYQQLCLAYAYGDGRESSCENVVRSVSRLLYGMPVQSYAAIDLSAIADLNDAVGGVEVVVPDDSALNKKIFTPGSRMLLKGSQAESFVRSRNVYEVDSNLARMARQKQYIIAYIHKVLQASREDIGVPVKLYKIAAEGDNMVTNVNITRVSYLATLLPNVSFSEENLMNVPGTVEMGEKYAEYHVDDKALYEMILELFYIPEETEEVNGSGEVE